MILAQSVPRRGWLVVAVALTATLFVSSAGAVEPAQSGQWYKGNTHAHTAWSDGRELPELAADWYKSHGYHFLCFRTTTF